MDYEVILDSGETANKCTIAPLSYRSDFCLIPVRGNRVFGPLKSSILLHHEGRCLSLIRKSFGPVQGIASIDCVWRRLDGLIRRIEGQLPLLARIPEGFETAYPRHSAHSIDPAGGLATIEAIFVASAMLGNWDVSLLSEYYFGRKFVELNKNRFIELGVHQASLPEALPTLTLRPRNSMQRRRDRGKFPSAP
jgi:pre-rRNA-processing protein TSR3